ncbi:MFS transporter [Methanosphaerula palustris]|uniref:Uncharacterized protein n=1 Tax=Methanosphaerula palustris (strain ATCC BAA-1556 / DSM 19958 / E1-9c) TaxID=521011 RepID=B8GF29_METPE|nr:hypothetical protein [Methanosphaerula palustris]ACL17835.1 hypothetical protein Mpal_2565 [Methanosphaerula palustris E1-9c]
MSSPNTTQTTITAISAPVSISSTPEATHTVGGTTAGTGFAYAPLNSAVMGEAPLKDRGATSGLIKMMSNLGSSLGVALVMLVTTVAAESKMAQTAVHMLSSTEMARAFDLVFFFLMCTVVLGIVLMLLVKEHDTGYSTEGEPVTPY